MKNIKISTLAILIISFFILSCSKENGDFINDNYLDIPDIYFETKLIEQDIDSDVIVNQQILKSDAEALRTELGFDFGAWETTFYDDYNSPFLLARVRRNVTKPLTLNLP